MIVAALAMIGLLLSVYLLLHHYGLVGELACGGSNSCGVVQASRYSEFLGIPVAAYGAGGYLALLVVALAGLQPRWEHHAGPARLLALLSGIGVAFTIWLTYVELFVLHAVCRWCVASAVIIALIFVVSLLSLRTRPSASPQLRDQQA